MATRNPAFDYESERRKRGSFSNPLIFTEFRGFERREDFGHL
jgi:hypothetical protein